MAVALCAVVLGVVAAASWYDLTRAAVELRSAREGLRLANNDRSSLTTQQGRIGVRTRIDSSIATLARAHRILRRSWALKTVRILPGLSRQERGAVLLVDDAERAATAARELLRTIDQLAQNSSLRDGAFPLAALQQVEVAARKTSSTLRALDRPASGLWASLGHGRSQFDLVVRGASSHLASAAESIKAARTFMGGGGPRRYFIAAGNNAEMRDQGMVLSYAIVTFDAGRLRLEHQGPITELALQRAAPIPVPAGMALLFGDMGPNQLWQSVNATADFKWSGQAMVAMYQQATGLRLDGVVALDVPGLAAILRVVGPVDVPGITEPIDATNASRILLSDLYAAVPAGDQTQRVERLGEVAAATMARITAGSHDAVALGEELGASAAGGHLRLWSANATEERAFESSGLGGGPATVDADRTFHLAVQNVNATKLDYFVHPHVKVQVLLSPQGTAVVRTTVNISNDAPRNPPRSNQFGPNSGSGPPGEYVTRTQLWGPKGAIQLESVEEAGLQANQETARVLPANTVSVHFETILPNALKNGRLQLRFVPQPRLEPMDIEIVLSAPGWRIEGARTSRRVWDRGFVVAWDFRHH